MTQLERYLLATSNDPFAHRIMISIMKAGVFIAPNAGNEANRKRSALAVGVLTRPDDFVRRFALAVAAVADDEDDLTQDSVVYDKVAGVWDAMAGVAAADWT